MRLAGTRSWEFRGDVGSATNAALYVRDALGLGPFADADVPPALAASVPDRSEQLGDAERVGASLEWLQSWRATAGHSPGAPVTPGGPFRSVWKEAYGWVGPARFEMVRANPALIPWGILRDAVRAVARDRHVDEGDLRGSLDILLVRGEWWHVIRPGFVLASAEAGRNPETAARLVRACLESGLGGA
ncbi:hypothetical protein [Sinomonas sp. ASV322]|uniref:hypothetical protein n=1 Tax=Sinomonas sp. ASV322 TaxID=3041920 RepID=UPI0027DC4DF7|nr:hypothetical protein [Sinomonas sp. ASV322]MDQ4504086.1 hypothetical protein [Sinomonas sp. ASV322]